jgi:bifunctional UDP-N-acetylglucosamine pyrophosphorylase / glucosamine-1-phosphate N-acetyltransferase
MAFADFGIVIVVEGNGARTQTPLPTIMRPAGGRTLIEHVIHACKPLKARATAVVLRHHIKEVSAAIKPLGTISIVQAKRRGAVHALLRTRRILAGVKSAIVMPADAALVRTETLVLLARLHQQRRAAATILSSMSAASAGYDSISPENGSVVGRGEALPVSESRRSVVENSSGIYAFTLDNLWPCLAGLRSLQKDREIYFDDCVALLRERGLTVLTQPALDTDEMRSCKTHADLAEMDLIFRRRKREQLMDSGVTMQLPDTVMVDPDVRVGSDTIIEPRVQLLGCTRIGRGCRIGTGSILTDMTLEDGVVIGPYSMASASRLATGAELGPFSHLRFGVRMMKGARIGNFVEAKESTLSENAQANHLTYLGDASVGSETIVGAGTITCNYDGQRKNRTTIGRRVFVGADTTLVAPLRVEDDAYIGAGSTITNKVPAGALALSRERQTNESRNSTHPSSSRLSRKEKESARRSRGARKRSPHR